MAKEGTNTNKDVIYIDVDDEITAVIDKVRGSSKKIVALVLPKRATVLQSVVNMKLLRRAADNGKKNVVLITGENSLLPLAGSVGIHVAKSLQSKPEVPDGPERFDDKPETVEEVLGDEPLDASKSVGELAGGPPPDGTDETIELDDEDAGPDDKPEGVKPAKGKNRRFKIPNFNRFRVVLALGVVAVLLLGAFGYAAVAVLPKATVVIKTDSTAVTADLNLTLKTATDTQLDAAKAVVPAQIQEVKKTLTQQVPATGQQNNGEKAVGNVTMTAKNCTSLSTPKDVPAGTGVTANAKTYITQEKANFAGSGVFDGSCLVFKDTNVAISAQAGGAAYNVDSATFTVAGRSDVTASGSASGGTDDIVKVISQADIDGAKQKIGEQDTAPIQQELKTALIGRSLYAMDSTFGVGATETKNSAEAGAPAETVTVTQTISYTMFGVKQADLEKVAGTEAEKKIDTKRQSIVDYGLDKASFSIQSLTADTATVAMQTTVVAGAELDVNAIKKQIAGKKAGDAKELISANPGVTDVDVRYSPFWVNSIPKKTDKITVTIQEPQAKKDATSEP